MEKKYAPRLAGKNFSDKTALLARSGHGGKPLQPRNIDDEEEKGERIAKKLARLGLASRREAEMMIAAGRVAVNGRILTSPAVNIMRGDSITVDGNALPVKERTRLWLYHKPAGLITTSRDPAGRKTVFDTLPEALPRVLAVGRLDINTEGLLLLTNDGGLARVLELPSTGWVRRYRVRAHGKTSQQQLDRLKDGIVVDGIFYGAAEAVLEREQGSNSWLSIAVKEGKNHEIKNILGALGLKVTRLIRISFGPFQLADLEPGMVREVRGRILRDQLGAKLVQEANLDFAAPVTTVFPNGPVAARSEHGLSEAMPDFANKDGRCGDKAYPRKAEGLADKDMRGDKAYPRKAEGFADKDMRGGKAYPRKAEGLADKDMRGDKAYPRKAEGFADKDMRGGKAYPRKAEGFADKDRRGDKAGRSYQAKDEEGWISSGRRRPAQMAAPQERPQGRPSRNANVWHGPGSRARTAAIIETVESERRPRPGGQGHKAAHSAAGRVSGKLFTGRADRQNKEWGEGELRFDRQRNRPGRIKAEAGEYGEKAFGEKHSSGGGRSFGSKKFGARPFGNKAKYLPEGTENERGKERRPFGGTDKTGSPFKHGRSGASKFGGKAYPRKAEGLADKDMRGDKTGSPFKHGRSGEGKLGDKAYPRKAEGLADKDMRGGKAYPRRAESFAGKDMRGGKPSGRGGRPLKRGRHADNRR